MTLTLTRPAAMTDTVATRDTFLPNPQLPASSCVPEEGTHAYELLERHNVTPLRQQRIPREYFKMPADERDAKIRALREQMGDRLVILGHHYQRDEVIQFADFRGDSWLLSKLAAERTDAGTAHGG